MRACQHCGKQLAEGNILPACPSCNASKADKLLVIWRREVMQSDFVPTN